MRAICSGFALILLAGCASGLERELVRVNESAKLAPGNCQDHVRAVAAALNGRYQVQGLYTNSNWVGPHISAIVETPEGRWILDNGALMQLSDVNRWGEIELPRVARIVAVPAARSAP